MCLCGDKIKSGKNYQTFTNNQTKSRTQPKVRKQVDEVLISRGSNNTQALSQVYIAHNAVNML